jgi:hypothetical protein
MALSISQTFATTLFHQSDDIADVVFKNNALLAKLKKKGRIKKHSGGYELRKPVMYNQTGNGKWYSGLETLSTNITDDLTAYVYEYKQRAESIGVTGREKRANKGNKYQLIDLMDMKMEVGISRLKNAIAESIHGDGTGSSGKEFDGIQKHISTTPSTGVIGGIDRSSYSWARNVARGTTAALTSATIQSELAALIVQLVRGGDSPDLAVADNTAWTKLHDSFTAIQRIQNASEKGMAGFRSLNYMGVDCVLDGGYGDLAADDEVRVMTTDYWSLDFHEDGYFKPISPEDRSPVNQDAEFTILLAEGNLCCSAHPFQGVLYDNSEIGG